jgi:hypothetical protein
MKLAGALVAIVLLAALGARCPREVVRAEGAIVSIAADRRAAVLRRDDIVGATRGLPLSFTLDDPAILGDLTAGTAVRFVYSQRFGPLDRTLETVTASDTGPRTHDHRPRHGGVVAMIDRLHIEARATRNGQIRLWLSDFWRQPLPTAQTEGTVTVATAGRRDTLPVQVAGDTLQATAAPFAGPRVELHAALRYEGRAVSADFVLPLDGTTQGARGRTSRRCRSLATGDTRPRCVIRFAAPVTSVATAGRGDTAIVANADGELEVWRLSTAELLTGLAPPPPSDDGHGAAHTHRPPIATVSADGQTGFVGTDDAILRYNLTDGTLARTVPLKGAGVRALAAAPDGSTVLVANPYGASAWLYDFTTNRIARTIPAAREVTAATFSADGRMVAIGDESGGVTVASLTDESNRTFVGLEQSTRGVAITDDDVIGLGRDGAVAVWARAAGTARLRIDTQLQNGRLAVSSEARVAAVAGDARIQLYALADGRLVDTIDLPSGRITGIALNAASLVVTDARGRMTIHDLAR